MGVMSKRGELRIPDRSAQSDRRRLAVWVATEILPYEHHVRAWLRPRVRSPDDAEEILQEAYAKLASLTAFDQIARPHGYFFQIVRNLFIDQVRRNRIVRIDAVGDLSELPGHSDPLDPERIASGRQELSWVLGLIEALPPRCRDIVKLRKIDGLSQRDIATRLGVTESVVENDGVKGMLLLVKAMSGGRRGAATRGDRS